MFICFANFLSELSQLGKYMSRAVHIAFEDLKKYQAEVKDKDTRIVELELDLKNLKILKEYEVSGL